MARRIHGDIGIRFEGDFMMSAAHTVFMVGDRRPAKLDRIQPTWYGGGQEHGHNVNVMGEILIRVER